MPIKLLFSYHKNYHRALYIKDDHVLDADLGWQTLQNNDTGCLDCIYWGRVLQVYSSHAYIRLPKDQIGILPLEHLFPKPHEGQSILVQVRREAIPDEGTQNKGPLLTQKIVLAGRFCLFHPFHEEYQLSSKINDPAVIKRFQGMFSKKEPITLRESATHVVPEQIFHEIQNLQQQYNEIMLLQKQTPCNTPYLALSPCQRWIRDLDVNEDVEIVIDNDSRAKNIRNFIQTYRPDLLPHVHKNSSNIFDEFGVEDFWDSLFLNVIDLPPSGNIVINMTAAAVIVDINKNAIPMIIQQLKCRHLGGNIIMDFAGSKNHTQIRKQLVEQIKHHAAFYDLPLEIFGWSKLGWLEARLPKRYLPIPQHLSLSK